MGGASAGGDTPQEVRDKAAARWTRRAAAALALDALLSAALALSVLGAGDWRRALPWSTRFWSGHEFHHGVGDVSAMCLARLVTFPAALALASLKGSPGRAKNRRCPSCRPAGEDVEAPLLGVTDDGADAGAPPEGAMEARTGAMQACRWGAIAAVFLTAVSLQGLTAVKAASFQGYGAHEGRTAALFGCVVAAAAAEAYATITAIQKCTARVGVLRPELHPHELRYNARCGRHTCDVCKLRMYTSDGGGWKCKSCDFDVCVTCFKRRNVSGAEGAIRGDRGAREEEQVTFWGYFRRVVEMASPDAVLIAAAFAVSFGNIYAGLVLPTLNGRMLDYAIEKHRSAFLSLVERYIAFSAAVSVMTGARAFAFSVVGRKLAFRLRNMLYSKVLSQDIAYFDGQTTGDIVSRLGSDVGMTVQPCQTLLGMTVQNALTLVGALFLCFHTSWRLSFITFTTVLPVSFVTMAYAKWSRKLNREIQDALGQASSAANEALGNIRTVRAVSSEPREVELYHGLISEALKRGIKDAWGNGLSQLLNNAAELGAAAVLLCLGGLMAIDGTMSIGDLITFQLYFGKVQNSYQNLQNVLTAFTRAAGAAQRVFSLVSALPDINQDAGDKYTPDGPPAIALDGVYFHYQMRPGQRVLNCLSLDMPSGTSCALVGRSGGGKSTIVHLVLRYYDPTDGRVVVDGRDLRDWKLRDVHRHVGMVAQDTQMFAKTIRENLEYGSESPSSEEVEAAVDAANAAFVRGFVDGLATRVGERGVRLSGGQKQRIAIARAFLRRPRLLLLDEATSALDAESEAAVQEALDGLVEGGGKTTLLVAHRLSTVMGSDKIAVIDKGAVVEEGRHGELLHKAERGEGPGIYAALVSRQLARKANQIEEAQPEEGGEGGRKKLRRASQDVVDNLLDQVTAASPK